MRGYMKSNGVKFFSIFLHRTLLLKCQQISYCIAVIIDAELRLYSSNELTAAVDLHHGTLGQEWLSRLAT
jgi:hypothetical protein